MRRWQNGYAAGCKPVSLRQRWFDPIPAHVNIDDLIKKWHDSGSSLPLNEYLGMTWNEYCQWVKEEQLPPEIEDQINESLRKGIYYTMDWRDTHEITEIHWRPGDPNALAESIIQNVTREMKLTLDGNEYLIRRV